MNEHLKQSAEKKASLKELMQPYILKPLIITLLLMVFQQWVGVNAVIYNIKTIFQVSIIHKLIPNS